MLLIVQNVNNDYTFNKKNILNISKTFISMQPNKLLNNNKFLLKLYG